MKASIGFGSVFALVLVACTVTNNGPATGSDNGGTGGGGNGADGGKVVGSGGGGGGAVDGGGGGGGGAASNVTVSQTAANVSFGSCVAPAACGGAVEGTWDYAGGCIDDPFAAVKQQCPSATTSNVTGSIAGTVNFVGDGLYRKAKASFSGTITLPVTCTMGAPCSAIQSAMTSAFDTVTCTGTSSCDCVVTSHVDVEDATTFTVSGNTLTTADGNTYDYCVAGAQMTERQTNSNATERGNFSLKKR